MPKMIEIIDTCDVCNGSGHIVEGPDPLNMKPCPRNHELGTPSEIRQKVTLSEFKLILAEQELKSSH